MHRKWRCESSGCLLDTSQVACLKVAAMARPSVAKRSRPASVLAILSPYSCRARRALRICAVLEDPPCGSRSGADGSWSGAAALGGRGAPDSKARRARRRRAQARGGSYGESYGTLGRAGGGGGDEVLELNVGGQLLRTTRSLLVQVPGSRLAAMFDGGQGPGTAAAPAGGGTGAHHPHPHHPLVSIDSAGRITLDVDPGLFRHVLSYLTQLKLCGGRRHGCLPPVKPVDEAPFRRLLALFGLLPYNPAAAAAPPLPPPASDPHDLHASSASSAAVLPYNSCSSDAPYSRSLRLSRSGDEYGSDGAAEDALPPPESSQALRPPSLQRQRQLGQQLPRRHVVHEHLTAPSGGDGSIGDGDGAVRGLRTTHPAAAAAEGTAGGVGSGSGTGKQRRRSRSGAVPPRVEVSAAATSAASAGDDDPLASTPRRHPPSSNTQANQPSAAASRQRSRTQDRQSRSAMSKMPASGPPTPPSKTSNRSSSSSSSGSTAIHDQPSNQSYLGGGDGTPSDMPSLLPGPTRPPHLPPPPPLPAACVSQLFYISTHHDAVRGGLRVSVYTEHDIRGGCAGPTSLPGGGGGSGTAASGSGAGGGGGGSGEVCDMFLDATYCESQLSLTFVSRREMLAGDVVLGLAARSHLNRKGAQIPCYGWTSNGCTYNDHTGGGRLGGLSSIPTPANPTTITTNKSSTASRCPVGKNGGAPVGAAGPGAERPPSGAGAGSGSGSGSGRPSPSEWGRSLLGEGPEDCWGLLPLSEEVVGSNHHHHHQQGRAVEAPQPLWGKGDCVELIVRRGAQHQQLLLKVNGQARDVISRLPSLKDWSWYVGLRAGGDVSCAVFQKDQYTVYWGNYSVKRYL